jgi:hypothetical protein
VAFCELHIERSIADPLIVTTRGSLGKRKASEEDHNKESRSQIEAAGHGSHDIEGE